MQEITDVFIEKTDEIKSAVRLQKTEFVSGEQNNILDKLMMRCLETGPKSPSQCLSPVYNS